MGSSNRKTRLGYVCKSPIRSLSRMKRDEFRISDLEQLREAEEEACCSPWQQKQKKEAVSGDRKSNPSETLGRIGFHKKETLNAQFRPQRQKIGPISRNVVIRAPITSPTHGYKRIRKKSPPHIFLSLRMLWAFINFSFSFLVRKSAHVWDPICLLPPPRNEKKSPFFILSCAPGWDNSSTR